MIRPKAFHRGYHALVTTGTVAAPPSRVRIAAVATHAIGTGQRDLFLLSLIAALLGLYLVGAYSETAPVGGRSLPTFPDDTYISMRYARHLAEGHGLVWNVGESPVEGYTNFLWTMWIAVLVALFGEPSYPIVASGALCHIASVILFYRLLLTRLRVDRLAARTATTLLAMWFTAPLQALFGLEAPLLLLVLIGALYGLCADPASRRARLTGCLLAGVLPLVRPDGVTLMALLAFLFWRTEKSRENYAVASLLLFGPVVALTCFRVAYFGDIFPNTYYLKVANRPGRIGFGIAFVQRFLAQFYGTFLLLPLLAWAIVRRESVVRVAGLGVVVVLLGVAYQGGDLADWWRFLVAFVPFFLILFASLTTVLLRLPRFHVLGVALCIVLVVLSAKRESGYVRLGVLPPKPIRSTVDNILLGLELRQACDPTALVADFWAGATPYFSELPTIDMLGKTDRWIARRPAWKPGGIPGHDKFDFDYVFRRRPDAIVSALPLDAGPAEMEAVENSEYVFAPLLHEKLRASSDYVPIHSELSHRWHAIYVRRDNPRCFHQASSQQAR